MEQQGLVEAIDAVRTVWLSTARAAGDALVEHGLTPALWEALAAIDPSESAPSMTVMAQRLHCNASNLSFIAGQLLKRDLATRAIDEHDRRSRVLVLTPHGRQLRQELVRATLVHSPLTSLSTDELDLLADILGRAQERMATAPV